MMDARRASARQSLARLPSRSIILPTPQPTPVDEGEAFFADEPRLPRGANARDYDLSVEDDYEVWALTKEVVIKGRATARLEVQAEKEAFARSAWDDEPLSELSTSSESESDEDDDERPRRKPRKSGQLQKERRPRPVPKWMDAAWPTPPASNDGDYEAPPLKRLKIDFKDFMHAGLYSTNLVGASGPAFPLPLHHGITLMEEECDFRLPYDIVHDYRMSGEGRKRHLERTGPKRPPKFQLIDKNWFPQRHKLAADPKAICQCKAGDLCGDECINRLMFYLCSPDLCPAGESCTNIPFSYRQPVHVRPFWTGYRGFGLKAMVDLAAGDFIMEYCGEVIDRDEAYRRVLEDYKDKHDYYLLDYDAGESLDARVKGNLARFANHSCDPNVIVTRWKRADFDEFEIGLFARVDVPAGTELTYDYGFVNFGTLNPPTPVKRRSPGAPSGPDDGPSEREKAKVQCKCGADNCIGWLGAKRKSKEERVAEVKLAARAAAKQAKSFKYPR